MEEEEVCTQFKQKAQLLSPAPLLPTPDHVHSGYGLSV